MIRLWIILVLSLLALTSNAQNATVTLSNGSVLHGYISAQRPGKDLTFHTTSCEMFAFVNELQVVNEQNIPFDQLSNGWKRWALENQKLVFDGNTWNLSCSQIKLNDAVHPRVRIIERGILFKYIQLEDDDYTLNWDKIRKITNEENESSTLLYDEIALKNGQVYIGTIVEQNSNSNLKIRERNGNVTIIDATELRSSRKVVAQADVTMWDARPYTNVILTKDKVKHEGFIVAQQVGDRVDESYIDILKMNGQIERITTANIQEYRYLLRKSKVKVNSSNLSVNGFPVRKASFVVQNGFFYTTENSSIGFQEMLPIHVESRDEASLEGWQLVKLTELTFDKRSTVYGFKVNNFETVNTDKRAERRVGSGLDYSSLPKNKYAITNPQHTEFYIIEVGDLFYNLNIL
jgi:hypothetical protein